ncbi:hypothetical protein [Flavobacterium caeni]|uniref:Chain length determinant protein n=1 Tax=Flavobacterium caeni TaxID=490189 RepID=A0A1G5JB70_9FLAO|nr:hypothetical protein [Flavobacterium caeni]SCY85585.1 hypothetical protein SAMN02927903_02612 [Flavobacterium caeni]
MSNTTKSDVDNEIDLAEVVRRIGRAYDSFLAWIFNGIQFLIKYAIVIVLLIIIGVGAGIFIDGRTKIYENEIIVAPNFGTTDYLYTNIELINSRIADRDTVFLASIGIKRPKVIRKIEIKPIVDIYNLVNKTSSERETYRNSQNFELVKLLSESGDINKVIQEDVTSRNYPEHVLRITTSAKIQDKDVVEPLLKFLNANPHYERVRLEYVKNVQDKMAKNDEMIGQINTILNDFDTQSSGNQKSDKLVYYNENSQLNDIIATKNNLLAEIGRQRIDLINFDQIIKKKSQVTNIRESKGINNKMKLILPVFLLGLFGMVMWFRSFYSSQKAKHQAAKP